MFSFGLNEPTKAKAKASFAQLVKDTPGASAKHSKIANALVDAATAVPKGGSISVSCTEGNEPLRDTLQLRVEVHKPQ